MDPLENRLTAREGKLLLFPCHLDGGPAIRLKRRADIRRGDIIVTLNGRRLENAAQLQRFIREAAVGERLTLVVLRNGSRLTKTLQLAEMPRS